MRAALFLCTVYFGANALPVHPAPTEVQRHYQSGVDGLHEVASAQPISSYIGIDPSDRPLKRRSLRGDLDWGSLNLERPTPVFDDFTQKGRLEPSWQQPAFFHEETVAPMEAESPSDLLPPIISPLGEPHEQVEAQIRSAPPAHQLPPAVQSPAYPPELSLDWTPTQVLVPPHAGSEAQQEIAALTSGASGKKLQLLELSGQDAARTAKKLAAQQRYSYGIVPPELKDMFGKTNGRVIAHDIRSVFRSHNLYRSNGGFAKGGRAAWNSLMSHLQKMNAGPSTFDDIVARVRGMKYIRGRMRL